MLGSTGHFGDRMTSTGCRLELETQRKCKQPCVSCRSISYLHVGFLWGALRTKSENKMLRDVFHQHSNTHIEHFQHGTRATRLIYLRGSPGSSARAARKRWIAGTCLPRSPSYSHRTHRIESWRQWARGGNGSGGGSNIMLSKQIAVDGATVQAFITGKEAENTIISGDVAILRHTDALESYVSFIDWARNAAMFTRPYTWPFSTSSSPM